MLAQSVGGKSKLSKCGVQAGYRDEERSHAVVLVRTITAGGHCSLEGRGVARRGWRLQFDATLFSFTWRRAAPCRNSRSRADWLRLTPERIYLLRNPSAAGFPSSKQTWITCGKCRNSKSLPRIDTLLRGP